MTLTERVKRICLSPNTEWPVIAEEQTPAPSLITSYVIPLAAISAIAGFIGGSLIGQTLPFAGTVRTPLGLGLTAAIIAIVMGVVGVLIMSAIINALAPTFGAQKNSSQALKVAVYSYTPAWVAGVLQIVPGLGLLALVGVLYGFYLLYLGLPALMKAPAERAPAYTAVVVVCTIVATVILSGLLFAIGGTAMAGPSAFSTMFGGSEPAARSTFDADSPLGRLEQLGQKLEQSANEFERAEKSGDANAQAEAAMKGLGTLLGGGRRVEPISLDQLTPLVPETFMGLPRVSNNAERNGMAGVMVATAEASYGEGEKNVSLEITDSGGVSGFVAMAGWVQGESRNDEGSERTYKSGNRLLHEKASNSADGTNEFAVILGDRFVVKAEGRGVGLDELKTAVSKLDLQKLEAMKDVGVQESR